MRPLLFETELPLIGALDLPSFFLMMTVAFLVATSLGVRDARADGMRVIDVLDLSLVALVVGLVGARLGHVFLESPWIELPVPAVVDPATGVGQRTVPGWMHLFCRMAGESHEVTRPWNLGRYYLLHPQAVFAVWNGGLVFYGGFLLGLPALYLFGRRRGYGFWTLTDLSAAPAAVGLGFGRVGCFLAGCCFGRPIPAGWLRALGHRADGLHGPILYPTQLMEAAFAFALAAALYRMRPGRRFEGQLSLVFLVAYSIWRPINEFFRGDEQRVTHGPFTTSQWISVAVLAATLVVAPRLWRRRRRPLAAGSVAPAPVAAAVAESGTGGGAP